MRCSCGSELARDACLLPVSVPWAPCLNLARSAWFAVVGHHADSRCEVWHILCRSVSATLCRHSEQVAVPIECLELRERASPTSVLPLSRSFVFLWPCTYHPSGRWSGFALSRSLFQFVTCCCVLRRGLVCVLCVCCSVGEKKHVHTHISPRGRVGGGDR